MTSYSLSVYFPHIFSQKIINLTVQFAIKYTRILRMREQSVAGLLFFLQRPVEEARLSLDMYHHSLIRPIDHSHVYDSFSL